MEHAQWQALLKEDEEQLRSTLRAHAGMEKDRSLCAEALRDELGRLLLRYNALCAPDRQRQALADCLAACARDELDLITTGRAEKLSARREASPWGSLLLLAALLAAAVGVFLLSRETAAAGLICFGAALVLAFVSGRLWMRERSVSVCATLDADAVWTVLSRSAETMDRKTEEFLSKAESWEQERTQAGRDGGDAVSPESLQLYGELLEALYSDNGAFALRQLSKLPSFLKGRGLHTVDYDGTNADLFELFPSRREAATHRPALLREDGRVLLTGRATEREA